MEHKDCIFCQISAKKAPAHIVWEDETHLAFLSIFPNTKGFTIVIPKSHSGSYAFAQSDQVLSGLILATKKVANILDNYFEDVGRTGMFFEGFGVDHLHSKLFPMHGTGDMNKWAKIESKKMNNYFEYYPGYLCSNSSKRVDDKNLAKLAKEIQKSYQD
ncbi:HIT family protein [Patescibacteria group bacterium]|nr:HIT family protein [Patescibacteria group bacterium]MBU1885377.1 HIT family protein [Patescibacteria group bacterium]